MADKNSLPLDYGQTINKCAKGQTRVESLMADMKALLLNASSSCRHKVLYSNDNQQDDYKYVYDNTPLTVDFLNALVVVQGTNVQVKDYTQSLL